MLALVLAYGLAWLGEKRRPYFAAAALALLLVPAVQYALAYARPDSSKVYAGWNPFDVDVSWESYGRTIMKVLPPRATVISCWQEGMTLRYFRYADPLRNDVDVSMACAFVPRTRRAWREAGRAGRPVFTTFDPRMAGIQVGAPYPDSAHQALWRLPPP